MVTRKASFLTLGLTAAALVAGSIALAQQPAKDTKAPAGKPAAGQPEMKLPPCMTEADMQACMMAGMPGKNHEWLAKGAGTWYGKNTMWMCPGAEAMKSDSTTTVTPMYDGRFVKVDVQGDMGGMPFNGMAIYGYDNVTNKFQATWIDNMGTGIMNGTGEVSADGKTFTTTYTYTCPMTKKPTTMREVQKTTGDNTKTMEMFAPDPKTGKEYKMMEIQMTRK